MDRNKRRLSAFPHQISGILINRFSDHELCSCAAPPPCWPRNFCGPSMKSLNLLHCEASVVSVSNGKRQTHGFMPEPFVFR